MQFTGRKLHLIIMSHTTTPYYNSCACERQILGPPPIYSCGENPLLLRLSVITHSESFFRRLQFGYSWTSGRGIRILRFKTRARAALANRPVSYASLFWQMQFSNVSTAVFPAHAKRCLKQDGDIYLYKKMPFGALRLKEIRHQSSKLA